MHTLVRAKLIYDLHLQYERVLAGKSTGIPNDLAYECIAEEIDPRKVIALFMKGYKPQHLVQEIKDVTPSCYEKETKEEESKCLDKIEAELFSNELTVRPKAYTEDKSYSDEDSLSICSNYDTDAYALSPLRRVDILINELTETNSTQTKGDH